MADLIITSPLRGWAVPLGEVPDAVFAQRIMGDGVAIHPLDGTICAPCDGTIATLHESSHAVVVRSDEGAEILVHVGLETVALKGRGFTALVSEGQRVARGEPLIEVDLDAVAQAAVSLVTPVIVTNGEAFAIDRRTTGRQVGACEELMSLRAIAPDPRRWSDDGRSVAEGIDLPLVHGIHARPAARIGECARGFEADVALVFRDKRADARSPIALMALGAKFGDAVAIEARGDDAEAALAAMVTMIATGMGEVAPPAPAPAPVATPEAGVLGGVVASPGLAIGTASRLNQAVIAVERDGAGTDAERAALARACATVRDRIAERAASAPADIAAVLGAHLALIDDPEIAAAADAHIADGRSAGFAWRAAIRQQAERIRATGDAHLIERIDDLNDLDRQVLSELAGAEDRIDPVAPGAILIARDLLPSQLVALSSAGLAGVCLERGGPTSHVAILCAGMGIPALVAIGEELNAVADGARVLLDAEQGRLYLDPDPVQASAFAARVADQSHRRQAAIAGAGQECRTRDGVRIEVFANLGSVEDARMAIAQGAEGVGLVRSEFLFLDRDTAPDEDQQLAAYQAIAEAMAGRPVIVRLLDIGGDKPAPYIPIGPEENPALGLRGIRVGLLHPDLLETQIRAILRVRPAGQCRIMIPMVADVAEVRAVRAIVERARGDLGITAPVEVGVMVETPAAAATADLIAIEADFLSIGSNDLTQYVLAMDRGNPAVAPGVDAMHPAVLRMIGQTCTLVAPSGRWVGLCGGLASDPAAIPILVGLGVTELSSVPGCVPEVKDIVRRLSLDAARAHAEAAMRCGSAAEVRDLARAFVGELER